MDKNQEPLYTTITKRENTQNITTQEKIYNRLEKINPEDFPVPEGWCKKKTHDGRTYWSCSITRHTQWLHPSVPVGKIMPNGLPYGWDKAYHPETGEEYYICHLGRYNTWSPPIPRKKQFYEDC